MPKHAAKTDSLFSRLFSARKAGTGQDGEQRDGAEIHRVLDIGDGDKPEQGILDRAPLKMMDLVYQEWEIDDDDGDENDEDAEDDEDDKDDK